MEEINIKTDEQVNNNKSKNAIIFTVIGIIILFSIILIAVFSNTSSVERSYLTYEKYIQIQNGMTYAQVVEILDGHNGKLDTSSSFQGYTLAYYTWSNNSGTKCIIVGFENNIVCSKSQYGL